MNKNYFDFYFLIQKIKTLIMGIKKPPLILFKKRLWKISKIFCDMIDLEYIGKCFTVIFYDIFLNISESCEKIRKRWVRQCLRNCRS
jgi:hypothetical protein